MKKSELLAAAAAVFARSTASELYVSSDGQVFEKGGEAHLHTRTAKLENPVKVGRAEAEAHVAAEAKASTKEKK